MNVKKVLGLSLISGVLVLWGCEKKQPEPVADKTQESAPQVQSQNNIPNTVTSVQSTGSSVLESAISFWNEGKKKEAVQKLVEITESDNTLWTKSFILATPQQDVQSKYTQILESLRATKQLCAETMKEGQSYLKTGDYKSAEKYFQAIVRCGKVIISANSLSKLDGQAIQKMGLKNLQQLYQVSGNTEKLAEISRELTGQ